MAKLPETLTKTVDDNGYSLLGTGTPDPFFPVVSSAQIDYTLWCQTRPYQLAVLQAEGNDYNLIQTYTLPIAPEALSISTPFAITTAATLGGIVEQHNGAPFRTISIQGTTGVLPNRSSGGNNGPLMSAVGTIFAGTVSNALNAVSAARAATDAGNSYVNPNVYRVDDTVGLRSGYYQFLILRGFLEHYANRKKNDPTLRLAFVVWKEQLAYLVTPVSFDLQRQAQSPLEYRFGLQLRAWKRIPLNDVKQLSKPLGLSLRGPNLLANVLNRINAARTAILSAKQAIKSIQPDFDGTIGNGIRETVLGLKDALSLPQTAWDMPRQFSQYVDREIADLFPSLDFTTVTDPYLKRQLDQMGKAATQYRTRSGQDQNPANRTLSAQDIALGRTQNTLATSSQKRLSQVLADPDNEGLLQYFTLDAIQLTPAAAAYRATQVAKAAAKSRLDYQNLRDQLGLFIADYSDKVGLGNATYNTLLGRTASAQIRTATVEDLEALHSLQDIYNQYCRLASIETEDQDIPNSTAYVATLAGKSDITFRVPRSKFAVPFPFGGTLERLAYTYLGDPDRWQEIATLNGLREPYVDEVGWTKATLYAGSDNLVQVADPTNLYVGQSVVMRHALTSATYIVDAVTLTGETYTLTLKGDTDLSQFPAGSVLSGYLPGTVNSGQLIYIPSDEPLDEATLTRSVPNQDSIDAITRVAGWDLQLTNKNDLAVAPDGDVKLAVGMANLIQRIKIVFATPVGSWLHHPEFGFAVEPGQSNADLTAQQVLDSVNKSFQDDPNLTVTSAAVEVLGPVVRLNAELSVRGSTAQVPVSVDVR